MPPAGLATTRRFVTSRRLLPTTAVLVLIQAAAVLIGTAEFRRTEDSSHGTPWMIFVPLLSAALIGMSLRSPLDRFDRLAVRRLAGWRLAQFTILFTVAAVGTVQLTADLTGPATTTAGLRNLIGFTGLALLTAGLAGGHLSWLPPVTWALTAATLGDPRNTGPAWDWPVRPDNDFDAFALACTLGTLGAITILTGTREPKS